MIQSSRVVVSLFLIAVLCGCSEAPPGPVTTTLRLDDVVEAKDEHGVFTGDVKLVLYVADVRRSVEFYEGALGFKFHHFHDYTTGESVKEWTRSEPPIYAEMSVAGRRFGIHLPSSPQDKRCVGAAKLYFRVKDLDSHHRRVNAWGAQPGPVRDKPWMRMFYVTDPDGHRIYFASTEDAVHGNPWHGE